MKSAKLLFWLFNAIIVGILVYFISHLDYEKMGRLLEHAEYDWLLLGLAAYLLSLYFKIIRFGSVMKYFGQRFSFSDLTFIQMTGIAIAMITPGRIGEASKIYLLHQRAVPVAGGTAATIFERLFDFLFLSAAAVGLGVWFVPDRRILWVFAALGLIVIALLFSFRFIGRLTRFLPAKIRGALTYLAELRVPHRFRHATLTALFSIATWSAQAILSWATLKALGIDVSPYAVIGIEAVGTLAAIFSFLPLGLGAMDLSMLFLYSQLGIDKESATLVVAVSRTIGFGAPLLVALIMTAVKGSSFSEIRSGFRGMRDNKG